MFKMLSRTYRILDLTQRTKHGISTKCQVSNLCYLFDPFAGYMGMTAYAGTHRIKKNCAVKRPSEGHQENNNGRSSRGTMNTVFEVGAAVSRGRGSA